jgi:pimeloyl-ACP methyl ester carboxylesterase/heme-degrading monooxygenase HmoA
MLIDHPTASVTELQKPGANPLPGKAEAEVCRSFAMVQNDAFPGAESGAQYRQVSICSSFSGATFIQLWQMTSADEQRKWLHAMHRNIHLLQVQPGYRSMSLHLSLDGRNVIVYAQWDSNDDLIAAVERPEVKAARNELDSHGEPDGAIFTVDSVAVPDESFSQTMQIDPGNPPLTMVNFWAVDDHDKQHSLLSAMKTETTGITSKPGFRAMAFHRSIDGRRVAVYAQWDSLEAFNRGITEDPAAIASRARLAQFGDPSANTYTVDSVNLPIAASQREASRRCNQRWTALGFTTRMIRVNGVSLHVAEAGEGDPVLLLHGYPQSGEAWRFVAPELAKGHHLIIPDLRGMGLSEASRTGYDLANLAEDIHQLVLSFNISKIKVVGHDWGGAVGAVYALRYREEVTHLAFVESALAGAGFETLWNFSRPNGVFAFIPFLLMGEGNAEFDTTWALLEGRESIFLRHLWSTFTGDQKAAPFQGWSAYVEAMALPGIAASSSSYYRAAYASADQVRALVEKKLEIPVLAVAGERGIGVNHEAFVRAFSTNIVENINVSGAGHFVPEERPTELTAALQGLLARKR